MQIPEFLFVLDFNNFLLTNARDRRKINSDRYRFQFDVNLGVEIFVWGGCGTVQTGTGKVDPARIFKCTTAARAEVFIDSESKLCLELVCRFLEIPVQYFLRKFII